jgi:hypothetical protein
MGLPESFWGPLCSLVESRSILLYRRGDHTLNADDMPATCGGIPCLA